MRENLVAGIFTTRARAEAAYRDLLRIGLTEHDIELGVPEPGRYRIEDHEAEEIGQGAAIGVAIGVPVGSLVGIGVLLATVPGILDAGFSGIGVSALVGGFWGIFFGGLGGVVPKVLAQSHCGERCEIQENGPELMIVARTSEKLDDARKVMRRRGAHFFLTPIPASRPAPDLQAIGQYA